MLLIRVPARRAAGTGEGLGPVQARTRPARHREARPALTQRRFPGRADGSWRRFRRLRQPARRRGGETLFEDSFGWFAAPAFQHKAGEKLRLAMLAAPCGVRAQAIRELDEANIGWVEAFTGGGVAAIAAAIASGLAVAPLARRVAPPGTVDIGAALSLPRLGNSAVVLHSRVSDGRALGALRTLAATFRGVASKIGTR
jgi:hypothetical protein